MSGFQIIGDVLDVETIATRPSVVVTRNLQRRYGGGRWRKLKGTAIVRFGDGTIRMAEIHWFEAHGLGRTDLKSKRMIR